MHMRARCVLGLCITLSTLQCIANASAQASATLDAPSEIVAGANIAVKWTGPNERYDKIGIAPSGSSDSTEPLTSSYLSGNPTGVRTPEKAGSYELRYVNRKSESVLARKPLEVRPATASLEGPGTAGAGSAISVKWTGPKNQYDKIGIVAAGAPDRQSALRSEFINNSPTIIKVPEPPGNYEIRYLTGQTGSTLAKTDLTITAVSASVEGLPTALSGALIQVSWTGPNNQYDKIGIVTAGAPDRSQALRSEFIQRSPASIKVPEPPGNYEIRYLTGQTGSTLAKTNLTVTAAEASVEGPTSAVAGATIAVRWTGPNNQYDKIGIVAAAAPETQAPVRSEFLRPSSVNIRLPDQPGDYEIRYLTGQTSSTLAKARVSVTPASASIEGPVTAVAGTTFGIGWTGPANQYDHIVAVAKSATDDRWAASGFIDKQQHPLPMRAPLEPGAYELRYLTGNSHLVLARAELQVTPGKVEPGMIAVSVGDPASGGASGAAGAVEIVLDASGSMLQRIGSQRRIDIAAHTLKQLTSTVIPAGTPFALRVFGRDAASCQTALELPLKPLDATAVDKQLKALEPKQGARTPIAASLEAVAADLRAAKGERLVILVTDGEETCGGDPVASIRKLKQAGVGVRINIVGFAIDDAALASTFRLWSDVGGGAYFEARDAAGLERALTLAARAGFEVLDARKAVVARGFVGDPPLVVPPGEYTVKLNAKSGATQAVTVRPKATNAVRF